MDPDEIRAALQGHEDVLGPELERHKAFFSRCQCMYCGGGVHEVLDPNHLFTSGGILPKYLAECSDCGAQFEPYTGIEIRGQQKDPFDGS